MYAKIPDSFKMQATLTCPTEVEIQVLRVLFIPVLRMLPIRVEFRTNKGFYDYYGDDSWKQS